MVNLPEFKGRPLIEIPKEIPTANLLEGDFGKAVLKEYQKRAKSDYNNASALNVLSYNGVVEGSNPFAVVLVNQIVGEQGLRTASPVDLESILKTGALDLREQYEDSALVLRSEDEPNEYLAKNLSEQVKERGFDLKDPVMISLIYFKLENDNNSPHKLSFRLTDNAEIIPAPQLDNKNDLKDFSKTNEKGLPIFNKNGDRTLYTTDSGLSRLFLYGNLDLFSSYGDLSDSDSGGRVVVVSGEATKENFQNKITGEINKAYQDRINSIKSIRDKALADINKA